MPRMPEVFTAPVAEALRGRGAAGVYYEGITTGGPDALVRSFAARRFVLDDPWSAACDPGRFLGARTKAACTCGAASPAPASTPPGSKRRPRGRGLAGGGAAPSTRYFAGKKAEDLTRETYDRLGLDVRDVLERSDL